MASKTSAFIPTVAEADLLRQRTCVCCGQAYSVADDHASSPTYFHDAHRYEDGCWTHCLDCWLGIEPETSPEEDTEGNLLCDCGLWLKPGIHLAVMPIARVTLDVPIKFGESVFMYPAGIADLNALNIVPNDEKTYSLAELSSALSIVDQKAIEKHATVAFPVPFDWDSLWSTGHRSHMEFIRWLSETVDRQCLDVIRYRQCEIGVPDALPGRAGQLDSNHMMAGALLYNPVIQKSRIIGGAAFTHFRTRGLGLPITTPEVGDFPQDGEVGNIVGQALSLYGAMLETDSETSKFVQAMSLLEFLAEPDDFMNFPTVSKIIARHIAKSRPEYDSLLLRFKELTSKKDPATGVHEGYRTRIVHIGERLNDLLPETDDRRKLFVEVDGYIRKVIDHMIEHSDKDFEAYKKIREQMKPFEIP